MCCADAGDPTSAENATTAPKNGILIILLLLNTTLQGSSESKSGVAATTFPAKLDRPITLRRSGFERTHTELIAGARRMGGAKRYPSLPGKRNVGLRSRLERLHVGYSIHQQHTKKQDQIEHGKHEQATRRLPFLVIAPTDLP